MAMVPIPTPQVLWRKPPVLALAALPGTALARLGSSGPGRRWGRPTDGDGYWRLIQLWPDAVGELPVWWACGSETGILACGMW
jgi:hypothetical protein